MFFLYTNKNVKLSLITALILTYSHLVFSNTGSQNPNDEITATEVVLPTKERRNANNYYALATYSPIDLLIPNKMGITFGLIESEDITWDFEWMNGSLGVPHLISDIGRMSDSRVSIIKRSYSASNSFNFNYGITYFDFGIHLGDDLISKITGGNYPSIDLVSLKSLGVNIGLGNRWTFEHDITLGVDWISWAQPLITINKNSAFLDYATDASDRDNVKKALSIVQYFPRWTILKLQIGILF